MGFFLTTFRTGHETAFWTKYKIILTVPLLNNTDFLFCPKKILIYSKQTVFCFSRTLHKDNIIFFHYQLYFLLLCTWCLFLFCFGLGFFVCGGFICNVLDDSDWLLFGILLFQNLQIKHQSADHIYHIHIW